MLPFILKPQTCGFSAFFQPTQLECKVKMDKLVVQRFCLTTVGNFEIYTAFKGDSTGGKHCSEIINCWFCTFAGTKRPSNLRHSNRTWNGIKRRGIKGLRQGHTDVTGAFLQLIALVLQVYNVVCSWVWSSELVLDTYWGWDV